MSNGLWLVRYINPIEYVVTPFAFGLRQEESVPPGVADWVEALPFRIGLDEVIQRGSSTVKDPNGGYITKTAMQRSPDADGVVWNLQGQEFDLRTEVNRLPKETALMFRFTLNAPWVVQESKAAASKLVPEAATGIQQAEAMISMSGIPLDAILQGLYGGITFALCLNQDVNWALPVPGGIEVPQMGLVLMVDDPEGVLHQTLLQRIQAQIPGPLQPSEETVSNVKVHRFNGLPLPLKIMPQFASFNNRLVVTTDSLWMDQMIANVSGEVPSPLLSQLEGIEDTRAHQAWVVGGALQEVASDILDSTLEKVRGLNEDIIPEGFAEKLLPDFLDFYPNVGLIYQGETLSTSIIHHKRAMPSSTGGAQSAMVAPAVVGMLAAIAVPSFTKARENAQQAQCMHQLRQIDSAKQMWAIENGQPDTATPTWEDLMPYLTGKPECPMGGTYEIGAVGEPPSSSILGPLR